MNRLFLMLFLLCFNLSKAQYFSPKQSYLAIGYADVDFYTSYSLDKYSMVLDSIRNDTQYYSFKLYKDTWEVVNPYRKAKYHNGKIWGYTKYLWLDTFNLFYDFNAKLGDTLKIAGPGIGNNLTSMVVDSINRRYYGSHYLKTQYLRNIRNNKQYVVVDSIGSLLNGFFLSEFFQFESGSDLVYVCRDSELLYWQDHPVIKSRKNTCSPILYRSSIHSVSKSAIEVYPNPVVDLLNIAIDDASNYHIQLYNGTGQSIYEGFGHETIEMDLSLYPAGFYVLQMLNTANNRIYYKTICKQ